MHIPTINISIRWKLIGAFFISALCPSVLLLCGVPIAQTIFGSLLCAAALAWYSSVRILRTFSRVQERLPYLRPEEAQFHRDELLAFEQRFSHLVTAVEQLEGKNITDQIEPETIVRRTEWRSELATGSPVCGEAVPFPRGDGSHELAQVTGEEAAHQFASSIASVKRELDTIMAQAGNHPAVGIGILEFQQLLLQDESLIAEVESHIKLGAALGEAVDLAFTALRNRFEEMPNAYFRARSVDCEDLRHRMQSTLRGQLDEALVAERVAGKIVICEQLMPSEVLLLVKCGAVGVVAEIGTRCSHTEILLSALDFPSLSRFRELDVRQIDGVQVLLDCQNARLVGLPDAAEAVAAKNREETVNIPVIREPVTLKSGTDVVVAVTINNIHTEVDQAVKMGADAVGLFRSEVEFIARKDWPTEQELTEQYSHLVQSFAERPVVMRMLDLGGDKLPGGLVAVRHEDNPCMGERSMRLLLANPDLFRRQTRAMLRAANEHTSIIFPMVSGWYELEKIRALVERYTGELKAEGATLAPVRFGLMIEVPSVVERFADYVEHFDTFNLGTNDLTQYALAVDRNNDAVADYYACHHPSLLSMIQRVCLIAAEHGKEVNACGEMARDPRTLPVLVGLGIRRFSVPLRDIGRVKLALSELDLPVCEALAERALACRSTPEVEGVLGW